MFLSTTYCFPPAFGDVAEVAWLVDPGGTTRPRGAAVVRSERAIEDRVLWLSISHASHLSL